MRIIGMFLFVASLIVEFAGPADYKMNAAITAVCGMGCMILATKQPE